MKIYQDLNYTKKWPKTFEVLKTSVKMTRKLIDDFWIKT